MIRRLPLWIVLASVAALFVPGASFARVEPSAEPAAVVDCAGAWLCDGFEDQQGGAPAGRWQVSFPDCQGTGTAAVDTAVAQEGSRSIRVNGGGGYCNHVFVGTGLADVVTGDEFFVRFWVRHSSALPPAHVTFLAMRVANDADRDLRMGGQNAALQWNRESDDATLPEQSPTGVSMSRPLPVGAWTCVEFRVDMGAGHLETWVNDEAVPGLVVDGVPTHDVDSQWLNRPNWRPQLADLRIGWESYGSEPDTLWFDHLAVDGSRVGCAR